MNERRRVPRPAGQSTPQEMPWRIIRDKKDGPDKKDRRPHAPSPDGGDMPYWRDERNPGELPSRPDDGEKRGVADVDYKL